MLCSLLCITTEGNITFCGTFSIICTGCKGVCVVTIERFQHVIKITSLSTCRHVGVQLVHIEVWELLRMAARSLSSYA